MMSNANAMSLVRSKNSPGYSVVELLAATAIGSTIFALVAVLINLAMSTSLKQQDMIETETELLVGTYHLTNVLSQAVELNGVTTDINTYQTGTVDGVIRTFTNEGTTIAGTEGRTYTIAVFNRETTSSGLSGGAGTFPVSTFRPTGIFYQKPTANTAGALYIDLGGRATANLVQPDATTTVIHRLVEFQVTEVRLGPGNEAISARIRMVLRYFNNAENVPAGAWCPAADIGVVAGCVNNANFRDLVTQFQVIMGNNDLTSQGINVARQGTNGLLYFFRMLNPVVFN